MYLTHRFYYILLAISLIIGIGYLFPVLFSVGRTLLGLYLVVCIADAVMLYAKRGVMAKRICSDRFSNGDKNKITLEVENLYSFPIDTTLIDEAPSVFQRRNINYRLRLQAQSIEKYNYYLTPTERGEYGFGKIRVFARTKFGLVERRYSLGEEKTVKVYPSFLMLHHYELLAMSQNLSEMGIKRLRKAGNNTEFEQIKDYVQGDDFRTINWKASARRHQLMVNIYQDERSQQIISVIDKGRVMQQTFKKMTLLDYSINAALMLSYVCIRKDDKAGLLSFADKMDTYLQPSRNKGQMERLMEQLYAQKTNFSETDFSNLCVNVNQQINKRSLLVIYTNFSGMTAMRRQLPYLKLLSHRHKVLVVFFQNSEVGEYIKTKKDSVESYYQHVIAEKFSYEQRLIVSTLRQNGILSLLTTPEKLSIDVVNKYLELKQKQAIV